MVILAGIEQRVCPKRLDDLAVGGGIDQPPKAGLANKCENPFPARCTSCGRCPQRHCDRDPFSGELAREENIFPADEPATDTPPPAERPRLPAPEVGFVFCASRKSTDDAIIGPGLTPSSTTARGNLFCNVITEPAGIKPKHNNILDPYFGSAYGQIPQNLTTGRLSLKSVGTHLANTLLTAVSTPESAERCTLIGKRTIQVNSTAAPYPRLD